jgi:hypothetical protein
MRDTPGELWYTPIMIKDAEILGKFERHFARDQGRLPYAQSRKLFTAMWKEGVALGVFPPVEPLAGVEVDIRMARILNTCLTKPLPG